MAKGSSRKTRKLNPPKNRPSGLRDKDTSGASQSTLKQDVLTDMPLDILCEIFKLLPPLDLLQLARTAKSFRKFLMNRTSKSIWTHVLSGVEDLPPCPDDLSEPQYAYLMLANDCHECLRSMSTLGTEEVLLLYLEARTQFCRACSLIHFKRWRELPEKVTLALAEFVPATTNRLTKEELSGPRFRCKGGDPPSAEVKRTRFHVNTALSLYAEYKNTKGAAAKKAWKEEQRKIWLAKEEFAKVCERYFEKVREREAERDKALREKRREQIREKLRALGWADEFDITQGRLPSEVYRWGFPAKELTEEEWEEMEERMVASMTNLKETRLKGIIKATMINRVDTWVKPAYTSFFFSRPPNTILPPIHEVCLSEAFRTPLCTLPFDQDLSADLFENAIAQLPAFAEEWRNNRIEQVLNLVRKSSTYKDTPADEISADTILPLASTIFHCTACYEKTTYPQILAHRCLVTQSWQPRPQDFVRDTPTPIVPREIEIPDVPSIADDVSLILLTKNSVAIWNGMKTIKFDDQAHQHMLAMLDALGWSRSTTADEMEAKQPYVECLCPCFEEGAVRVRKSPVVTTAAIRRSTRQAQTQKNQVATSSSSAAAAAVNVPEPTLKKKRKAARWMKAIQSCGNFKGPECQRECFAKLEGQDLVLATNIEQARQPPAWSRRLDCSMCAAQGGFTRDGLENHLILEHRVEHPDGMNGLKAYVNALNLWKNHFASTEPYVHLEGDST